MMALQDVLQGSPFSLYAIAAPVVLILGTLATVQLYTSLKYRYSLSISMSTALPKKTAISPPLIPYSIPFLGHAITFLAPHPGQFWAKLFQFHPRSTGACTLLLGGQKTYILFSQDAVQSLFKMRALGRDSFNVQVAQKGLGIHGNDTTRYYGYGEGPDHTGLTPAQQQEHVYHNFMMEKKSVNELTAEFVRVLKDQLAGELKAIREDPNEHVMSLYAWLQDRLFNASTTAFMGSRILDIFPNLREDFFDFDQHMLTMFFGVPKFLSPKPYDVREKALGGLIKWHEQMQIECKGEPMDPAGDIGWEPVYGSRANRARQRYYVSRGISMKGRAGMDLGFLFGLNSNAIPAVGWILMHILNPDGDPTLLSRVMEELETTEGEDGSLDIPTLIALPLLQSLMSEVLRLYVDVLVTRELKEELTLPLDDGNRYVRLEKNTIVMAPSWLGHRDEMLWTDPPADHFFAERFLQADPKTGKMVFSTTATGGKYFPFGGGKTICPGRVFAKQEVLASVAMVLLSFKLEFAGFVDGAGKPSKQFPGLRSSFAGSGIMAAGGDIRVTMKAREAA